MSAKSRRDDLFVEKTIFFFAKPRRGDLFFCRTLLRSFFRGKRVNYKQVAPTGLLQQFSLQTRPNHFSEYQEVEGIMIPHRQTIISEPGGDDVLHEIVVEQVRFDTILPEELLPDAGLTEMGDRKPEPTQ